MAYWGKGTQINSPIQRDPSAGVAFRGRSFRLNGARTRPADQDQTSPEMQQPNNQTDGVVFRGRSYRLNGN